MYNNILIPRNIEGRKEKLRQNLIKLLSQEIIENDLIIDKSFEGIPDELVKVKEIKGYILLNLNYIPSWLKNVKIYGNFNCYNRDLTTLKNCPQYIEGFFDCSYNKLTSLEGGPQYIGKTYNCSWNKLTSLKGCPKYIGNDMLCNVNNLKCLNISKVTIEGNFWCVNGYINKLKFNKNIKIKGSYID